MPVFRRPPWVNTSHRPGPACFASTATTTHWLPNFCAASPTSSGRATAAEVMLHLSAPDSGDVVDPAVGGPDQQQGAHVGDRADAAADGQRQEDARGGACDHIADGV